MPIQNEYPWCAHTFSGMTFLTGGVLIGGALIERAYLALLDPGASALLLVVAGVSLPLCLLTTTGLDLRLATKEVTEGLFSTLALRNPTPATVLEPEPLHARFANAAFFFLSLASNAFTQANSF